MIRTRRWLLALTAVLTMAVGFGIRSANAQTSFYGSATSGAFSISMFYDELDDYGQWVDYGDYGTCWVPADVDQGWRPYMYGEWMYTDYGWTWASSEPFGWATYHYGRWVFDPYYGWVWVPGTVWAPAWVAWREADDCVGWAPLPPEAGWSVSVGLTFGSGWNTSSIGYDRWCFVPRDRFIANDVGSYVFPVSRNRTFWGRSQDVTRFRVRSGSPINEGIRVANVERWSGRRVPRMRVASVDSPRSGSRQLDSRTVGFFRPQIRGSRRDFNRATEGRVQRQRVDFRGGNRLEVRDRDTRNVRDNRIQRDMERVRGNARGRSFDRNETRNVERRSRIRVNERPSFERRSAPDRSEVRDFMRQERGGANRERGFERRESAPERREVRDFQREERRGGGNGGNFERRETPNRREVRETMRERGRGQEARSSERGNRGNRNDREESSDDGEREKGGRGHGNGRGRK